MNKYCIMRVARLKSNAAVAHAARHNLRQKEVLNADIERSQNNSTYADETVEKIMGRLNNRLDQVDRKIRPDAVRAVEYVITRSPEANFVDDKEYFQKALDWVQNKHGKENVISVTAHMDEDTPHSHIIIVPLSQKVNKKGREVTSLSAKDYFSGKKKLSDLQTDFYEKVGRPFGLVRGKERSKTRHIPLKDFYRGEALNPDRLEIGKVPLTKKEEWKKGVENDVKGTLDRAFAKGYYQGKGDVKKLISERNELKMNLDQGRKFSERDGQIIENLTRENDHLRDRIQNPEKWKKIDQEREQKRRQQEKPRQRSRSRERDDIGMGW